MVIMVIIVIFYLISSVSMYVNINNVIQLLVIIINNFIKLNVIVINNVIKLFVIINNVIKLLVIFNKVIKLLVIINPIVHPSFVSVISVILIVLLLTFLFIILRMSMSYFAIYSLSYNIHFIIQTCVTDFLLSSLLSW